MRSMQIETAMIADFAEIVSGKLYLMGGGWDNYWVDKAPAQVRIAIAVGVRVGWDETNVQIPVRIWIEDDDGQEMVRIEGSVNVGRPAGLPPGSGQLAQMAANVPFQAPHVGGYRIRIQAGEQESSYQVLPFRVMARQSPAAG